MKCLDEDGSDWVHEHCPVLWIQHDHGAAGDGVLWHDRVPRMLLVHPQDILRRQGRLIRTCAAEPPRSDTTGKTKNQTDTHNTTKQKIQIKTSMKCSEISKTMAISLIFKYLRVFSDLGWI